jgi:hypothetical protein
LLAVSIPDLKKPDSQEISAFYLQNIYRVMYNATAPIPSALAEPPASSPAKYVVWVNSLWLLSLLISLAGALSATIEQRCALRHISITQDGAYSPEMRARIHAVFAKSESGGFNFQDTSAIMFCLHLSLFLFMTGVLIYFFNINRTTFYSVVWWIAIVGILYTIFTVAPIFYPYDLLYTPFSSLALRAYLFLTWLASQVFCIQPRRELRNRYRKGFIEGKIKSVEEAASKSSSTVDTEVLDKILLTLDEDRTLEAFFDAIPGFWNSNLVQMPLDDGVRANLQRSLAGFLDRTFSSTSVSQQVRRERLITCLKVARSALGPCGVSQILCDLFKGHSDEVLQSIARRKDGENKGDGNDDLIDPNVLRILAPCIIVFTRKRGDEWTKLVTEELGVPKEVFENYRANRNSTLLAILMHVTREALRTGRLEQRVLESLSQFDIRNTHPELQREFCTLWNDVVQKEKHLKASIVPTQILTAIHRLFSTLHRDTPEAPAPRPALASGPPLNSAPRAATEKTPPGNAHTSVNDTPDPIRGSTSGGRGPHQVEGTRLAPGFPSASAAQLPTPITTPSGSSQIPAMPSPSRSTDTAMPANRDANSHTTTDPSSTSTTAALSAPLHDATVLGQPPRVNNRIAGSQDDT